MAGPQYIAPQGGHPPQTQLLTGRAVFTEAYAVIPKGVMRDIVTSVLPFWDGTRAWILSRPLSGFAETFSQYIMEVAPGGGSDRPEPDAGAEGVLFVMEGEVTVTLGGEAHRAAARAAMPTCRRPAAGRCATTAQRRPLPLDPQALRPRRRPRRARAAVPQRAGHRAAVDAGHRRALGDDALRRSGRPAPRHARQHRHLRARRASSPSPRRMSWSTGSTCWRARRSTG